MPDNMNPYMDSGMNPNGYVPGYGQPGYVDETNPYAAGWDQGQYGMPQGYPGMPQQGMMPEEYLNPGNMASPQDIYANQAAQMGGMPGQYGMPYGDPNMPYADPGYGMGQPYADPYAQPTYPMGQPQYDPMQQVPMPGQTGQQAPVSPGQTGGFENPMQAAQQAVAEPQVPAAMPQPDPAAQAAAAAAEAQAKQQAAQHLQQVQAAQQQIKQQAAQQQAAQQASQQAAQQSQAKQQPQQPAKKQKRPQAQMQPMPTVGIPVVNPAKATKGRATLALILSILSIILALVPPVGLILAIVARKIAKSYKKNGGRAGSGDAAAVFSLVGIIFSVIMCGLLIWFIGYVNGALIGSKAYMNPISFFNNSPLGSIFKIPTS